MIDTVGYHRVSGPTQDVRRQQMAMDRDARKHELRVVGLFTDDGISASVEANKERPDYLAIMGEVDAGRLNNKVLWLSEASRLTRNIEEFGVFRGEARRRNIRVFLSSRQRVLDMNDADDRDTMSDDISKGEKEIIVLSKRVKDAVPVTLADKKPHGRTPYGYMRIYDPETRELVEQILHPEHAKWVKELCERYASGESCLAIARDFNERGIDCPHNANLARTGTKRRGHWEGAKWHAADISARAVMAVYVGKRTYNGSQPELVGEYQGNWPAIITEELHALCVARRAATKPRRTKDAVRHWLTGIAKCAHCPDGGYVQTRMLNGRFCYMCRQGHFSIPEAETDAHVLDELARIIDTGAWQEIRNVDHGPALQAAMDAVVRIDGEIAGVTLDFEADVLTETIADAKVRKLERQRRDAQAEVDRLRSLANPTLAALSEDLKTMDVEKILVAYGLDRRRIMTRELIAVTMSSPGRGGRHRFNPANAVVTAL